ncbi:DNA alkylation repair protein [Planococcus donghaensis]|uniref:DNA alkylation repair protein n=1 Tax=Planococcus donghaensis TaxID=414778 RepID=A0A1C7EIX1_9BACL|nr:DNA alkylation repair protein [Planococcus donghaensis]ANU23820.1 DNA alkylation repair protein [Planococcus donghaensis]
MKKLWDDQELIDSFKANRNPEQMVPMSAYMRNQFDFLGIKTPLRTELLNKHFSTHQLPSGQKLLEAVWKLYELPEREYQYAAIALLDKMKEELTLKDLAFLRQLIENKSWWDSVDSIASRILGHVIQKEQVEGTRSMIEWSKAENIWTNRAAILHQLKYKQQTDTIILSQIILHHATSPEFFIQKAIGWALREYAKTDAEWVETFVSTHELMPLSKREALKHIKK